MLNGKRYITINTDASYNHNTREAGLAFYMVIDIKGGMPKRVKHSVYVPQIVNHNAAEYWAVVYALTYIIKYNEYRDIDSLVVNTDSMAVISAYAKGTTNPNLEEVHEIAKTFFKEIGRPVRFKHVKAHTLGKEPRTYINNWCDQAAKEARKRGH